MKDVVASLKYTKGSVYKMNDVASLIRGLSANEADLQLAFCKSRFSFPLRKLLRSAIANGVKNFGFSAGNLFVKNIEVGKAFTLKRSMARGRGRSTRIEKKFSKVKIVLSNKLVSGK